MTPLFQACSDHAIAACRRHRTKSRTPRLTLFEQVEMDRGTRAEERAIGFADLANQLPAPAVCEYRALLIDQRREHEAIALRFDLRPRSAERRVGEECVRTCRSRWQPEH